MKPSKSILDRSFVYTHHTATNVENTWRRFGWQPISEKERAEKVRKLIVVKGSR
jgi:hypothetical protein